MPLPPVRLMIRSGMIVAVTVSLAAIVMSSYWILLVVLPALSILVHRRAPTTEFLCTLMGIAVGALRIMPVANYRPTNDLRDFQGLFWVIGGAGIGASVGAAVAWADRRIAAWKQRPIVSGRGPSSSSAPDSHCVTPKR